MSTFLYTHPAFFKHEMGPYHPESPSRLRAVQQALKDQKFRGLHWATAPRATTKILNMVHSPKYIKDIMENVPQNGHRSLDPDTAMNSSTPEAASRAVGAVIDAVDKVMTDKARNAFCAVRPPGHHAEPESAMGFCIFNNAAIGALYAHNVHGVEKIAVVDFDVHHGNGTQVIFSHYDFLFYASSHQSPSYPGTGSEKNHGPYGNICNVELAPSSSPKHFRNAYKDRIFPKLREWHPNLLIISAGFDAHARDPLSYLRLTNNDFAWISKELVKIAHECCNDKIVSTLEGGYDLEGLVGGIQAHIDALMKA